MVVVYHATRSLSLRQYLGHIPFGNAFGFGHAGVDFFFVLSGFIITHAHAADVGRPDRLYRYLWRRITRIYPIYWLVTGLEVFRASLSGDAANRLALPHIISSILLLPDRAEPLVGVAWTLRFEMLFYLVFALPIINRRFSAPLITVALLLVIVGTVAGPVPPWAAMLVSPFNVEFLIGIAVAIWVARRPVYGPAAFAVVGVLSFLVSGALEVLGVIPLNGLVGRLLYGGASGAILVGLVGVERSGDLHPGRAGIMLGNASYCLYLIHLSIIPPTIRLFAYFGLLTVLPSGLVVGVLVALSLVAAVALHLKIEAPMMVFIRRRTPRQLN